MNALTPGYAPPSVLPATASATLWMQPTPGCGPGTSAVLPHAFEAASAQAWTVADFKPLDNGATISASSRLRGDSPLAKPLPDTRRAMLLLQGAMSQRILQAYAQARYHAGLPEEAAWVPRMAAARPPVALAHADEFVTLSDDAPRSRAFTPLSHREGALVCPERFFRPGSPEPTRATVHELQAQLLHPRCAQMLAAVARLPRPPVSVETVATALHQHLLGSPATDTSLPLADMVTPLLQGDGAGMVRTLFPASVHQTLAASRLMPGGGAAPARASAQACEELLALGADALAATPPTLHQARALVDLLGARATQTLRDALVLGQPWALERVTTAYALLHAHRELRAALQPGIGEFDPLQHMQLDWTLHQSAAALAGAVARGTGQRPEGPPLAVVQADAAHVMAGRLMGMQAAHDSNPDTTADPGPVGEQGRLSRAELAQRRGREPVHLHLAAGDALAYGDVVRELAVASMGGFATGAARAMSASLELGAAAGGLHFVPQFVGHYLAARLQGAAASETSADQARTVRRVIEAQARLTRVPFEQAEREVLGSLFNERSFGTAQDLSGLRRLALCLHEQRRLDLLTQAVQGSAAGTPTLVHAVGTRLTGAGGVRVQVVGQEAGQWIVEPEAGASRVPPAGVRAGADGHWRVGADGLLSVLVDRAAPALQTPGRRGVPEAAGQSRG